MATIAKQPIEAAVQGHGSNPFTLTLKEGASQTFVKGELVFINGDGYVEEIGSNSPGTIYGVAAGDAHNNATAGTYEVPVELALVEQLFRANVLEDNLADHVLAQTDLGTDMAIQRDTTNSKTYLNTDLTDGVRVFTHKQARGTSIGDTNGQVLFNFKPNWIQMMGTS